MNQRFLFYTKQFGWGVVASHHPDVGLKKCSVLGPCPQTMDALQIHDF